MARGASNRVLGDRLWDDRGLVWFCGLGVWARLDEVEEALLAEQRVVVHGVDRPMRWLTAEQARRSWTRWREHFQVPGTGIVIAPDFKGLTYSAKPWEREGALLLGLQIFC